MKKLTKKDQAILNRLINDFNSYSELVALNRYKKHEEGITEWAALKSAMRDALGRFIFECTRRRPMILPIIMEV